MTWSTRALAALALLACSTAPTAATPPAEPAPAAEDEPSELSERELRSLWKVRSDEELAAELSGLCTASIADERPILLEFSAPWCIDCRTLKQLAHREPLRAELTKWHHISVDVGRFERHRPLLKAFEVKGIAHLVALAPDDCSKGMLDWPRLANGTFEPATGQGPRTPEAIRDWLVTARGRGG